MLTARTSQKRPTRRWWLALLSSLMGLGLAAIAAALIVAPSAPTNPFYRTVGKQILAPDGRPWLIHGLNRPSLEWTPRGVHLSKQDVDRMAGWGANAVRIPTNQDFLLADSCHASPEYLTRLDQLVNWIVADGMNVVIDLHWTDRDRSCPAKMGQQIMPDARSVRYLRLLAGHYRGNPHVFIDLFNEPHGVGWGCWQHGCAIEGAGASWQAVGMQKLYDTVRSAGFRNPVLVEGLDWGRDLSGVLGHRLSGYGIIYSVHAWFPDANPRRLNAEFGSLAGQLPIVVGEFGPTTSDYRVTCNPRVQDDLLRYFRAPEGKSSWQIGWLAWEWYAGGNPCGQAITDWSGTPSPNGAPVRAALAPYRAARGLPTTMMIR